jgi:hypothetical protein
MVLCAVKMVIAQNAFCVEPERLVQPNGAFISR